MGIDDAKMAAVEKLKAALDALDGDPSPADLERLIRIGGPALEKKHVAAVLKILQLAVKPPTKRKPTGQGQRKLKF